MRTIYLKNKRENLSLVKLNNDGFFVFGLVVERPFEGVVEKLFHLIAAREKLVPVVAFHLRLIVV